MTPRPGPSPKPRATVPHHAAHEDALRKKQTPAPVKQSQPNSPPGEPKKREQRRFVDISKQVKGEKTK